MLVFDVGANIGDKTNAMREKGAHIVCFEPQPECADHLRARFGNDDRVTVVQQGLGAEAGRISMSICDQAPTISTMSDDWKRGRFKNFTWNRTIDVDVVTLDDAITRFGIPDYCKIDVEGFELEVIKGLTHPLSLLSFEFTVEGARKTQECVRRLSSIGFHSFNVSYGENEKLDSEDWVGADEIISKLQESHDPLTWGDIFACRGAPSQDIIRLALREKILDKNSLEALRQAGLSHSDSPLRLHLGCGETILDGYVNVDYPQENHSVYRAISDYQADITALDFPDCTVDEVRLHHVFEHLNRSVAIAQLVKWHRWLKVGGRLVIETPDFAASSLDFSRSADLGQKLRAIRHLEGDQASAWAYHVGQWFPQRFVETLSALRYTDIDVQTMKSSHTPPLFNVVATASKAEVASPSAQRRSAVGLLRQFMVADAEQPTLDVWSRQLDDALSGSAAPLAIRHPPDAGGVSDASSTQGMFRNKDTVRLDQRRLEHLASLVLPISGRSVLEIGAEIGDRTGFFIDRECSICTAEGDPRLFTVLSERYHWMRAEKIDPDSPNVTFDERYEIVYACLDLQRSGNPTAAVHRLAGWCGDILILETPIRADQRRRAMDLLRDCLPYVYCTTTQPWHPDFPVNWDEAEATTGPTRALFVASRKPLDLPTLTASMPLRQVRH